MRRSYTPYEEVQAIHASITGAIKRGMGTDPTFFTEARVAELQFTHERLEVPRIPDGVVKIDVPKTPKDPIPLVTSTLLRLAGVIEVIEYDDPLLGTPMTMELPPEDSAYMGVLAGFQLHPSGNQLDLRPYVLFANGDTPGPVLVEALTRAAQCHRPATFDVPPEVPSEYPSFKVPDPLVARFAMRLESAVVRHVAEGYPLYGPSTPNPLAALQYFNDLRQLGHVPEEIPTSDQIAYAADRMWI